MGYKRANNSMRKIFILAMSAVLCLACASKKGSTPTVQKNVNGEKVGVESIKLQGIEMAEGLNEDGTDLIQRPYKWYAGIASADDKQVAIELAQREAYATISRVLNNIVDDSAERGSLANNGKVQKAIKSHWEQFSQSLTNACEPFKDVKVEYNQGNHMYTATAKVAVRGDRFNQMLQRAGAFTPTGLNKEEMQQFIDVNKSIIEAAKSH